MKNTLKRHPLTVAFENWTKSKDAERIFDGNAAGVYLANRIERAFQAGWNAKEQQCQAEIFNPST